MVVLDLICSVYNVNLINRSGVISFSFNIFFNFFLFWLIIAPAFSFIFLHSLQYKLLPLYFLHFKHSITRKVYRHRRRLGVYDLNYKVNLFSIVRLNCHTLRLGYATEINLNTLTSSKVIIILVLLFFSFLLTFIYI